ncbi:PREDICTED: F-box/kelch-repeat protein SKIP6 [Tarenaya hassleriana]|uniref:F-box/kelch-repeat protein SKIP6 n=1 Tax=Tarenaya hassleriana TaxID=28532 RepID=UPI00053C9AD4|nr:PREDICTED: F-box/kelch-repeat protein SKIP6 [Tarenaya hassleriana]
MASISSLPKDVVLECLARASKHDHPNLSLVSTTFRSLVSSSELYAAGLLLGRTEHCLYVCIHVYPEPSPRWYTLRPTRAGDTKLVSIPSSPSDLPSNSSVVTIGSEIFIIGGSINGEKTSSLLALDCRSHTWRRLPSMRMARGESVACLIDGKIHVIGEGLGLEERHALCRVSEIVVFEGSMYGMAGRTKCFAYHAEDGSCDVHVPDPDGLSVWDHSYCAIGNVMYSCDYTGELRWYDREDDEWRDVKFQRPLRRPRLPRQFKLSDCGGNLVILWTESFNVISCSEITCERRNRNEIWGAVKSSNVVLTADFYNSSVDILHCQVVTI